MSSQTTYVLHDALHAHLSVEVGGILEVLPLVYVGAHRVIAGDSATSVTRNAGYPMSKRVIRDRGGDAVGEDWTYPFSTRESIVVRVSDDVVTFVARRA